MIYEKTTATIVGTFLQVELKKTEFNGKTYENNIAILDVKNSTIKPKIKIMPEILDELKKIKSGDNVAMEVILNPKKDFTGNAIIEYTAYKIAKISA